MKRLSLYLLGISACVAVGFGLGFQVGKYQHSLWTQHYADMEMGEHVVALVDAPLVKWERKRDFGIVTGKLGTLTHEFSITNTGRGVLKLSEPIVENERVTCVVPKREIAPEETIKAVVSCTPEEGEKDFDYIVCFQTNAPTEPEIELIVQGVVHPSVWVRDDIVEVTGVPTVSVYKTTNQVYALDKNLALELKNIRIIEPEYAEFFAFEQAEMYHYDFSSVEPTPDSGKIITISMKPGLPDKVFSVTVEAETNIVDTPTVQFRIDFKVPTLTIPGVSSVAIPYVTTENTEKATESVSENAVPKEIHLDNVPETHEVGE